MFLVRWLQQVQEPDEAENEYLVIDIPSQDYLDPLLAEPKLKAENLSRIQGIFHFSPLQVVQDDKYSTWMNTFSSEIKHVMMNEASEGYGTVDGLRFNTQVNTVFPEVYKKILASWTQEFFLNLVTFVLLVHFLTNS